MMFNIKLDDYLAHLNIDASGDYVQIMDHRMCVLTERAPITATVQ